MKSGENFDYAIVGNLEIYGSKLTLKYEVYKTESNRTVKKGRITGRTDKLLAFFNDYTQELFTYTERITPVENVTGFDDDYMYMKYLKISRYIDEGEYLKAFDEAEAYEDKFLMYPEFEELYNIAKDSLENSSGGVFDDALDVAMDEDSLGYGDVKSFVKALVIKGYRAIKKQSVVNVSEDDSTEASLFVTYDIMLKKSFHNKLIAEIKKRGGDLRYKNVGYYYFSANDEEQEEFKNILLNQGVKLILFDKRNVRLDSCVNQPSSRAFDNGKYRHTDDVPFPVLPKGPANNAFSIVKTVPTVFVFEDISVSTIDRTKSIRVEFFVED